MDINRAKGSKFKVCFCDKVGVPLQINPFFSVLTVHITSAVASREKHTGCQMKSAKNTRSSHHFHLDDAVCKHTRVSYNIPTHNPNAPVTIFQVHVNTPEFKRLTAE